jgi:multisubunit Na+/H+ antiporter MnhC subunit
MNPEMMQIFWIFGLVVLLLGVIGMYCVLVTFNLVRALIGLEILVKAVTLLLVVAGYVSGHEATVQSLVITLIVIEVVVMTIAVGIVVGLRGHIGSLDSRQIRNLKG